MSAQSHLRRRRFLAVTALFAAGVPRTPFAAARKRVGMLGVEKGGIFVEWTQVFPKEFAKYGWIEGSNLELLWFGVPAGEKPTMRELREGSIKRAKEMAAAGLDCLVANGLPHAMMLHEATLTVPVVVDVPDPVGFGLARSLARPGGNMTGLHGGQEETALKTVELLHRLVPSTKCVAWIGAENFGGEATHYENAARAFGLSFRRILLKAVASEDAKLLRDTMPSLRSQGCLTGVGLPPENETGDVMIAEANRHRIALAGYASGFLFNYGSERTAAAQNAVRIPLIVSRILRGEKPGDIPFEGPDRYNLTVNLKAAQILGITVPPDIVTRADRVRR